METTLTRHASYAQSLLTDAENQLSGAENPEQWLIDAFGGGNRALSGVRVGPDTVLGLPAAWRSIDLISSKLGSMPAEVQRKTEGAFESIDNHPIERLLNRFCSGLYTCMTFRQTMTLHALLQGNGRAFINRDAMGAPESLTLMPQQSTYTIVINGEKYHVVYFTPDQYGDVLTPELESAIGKYSNSSNGSGGIYTVPDAQVLHIPGMSYNGLWGISLVSIAKDSFGLDQSGNDAVSYQFRNGGRPGLMLTAPKGMFRTAKEAKEFMDSFLKTHEGTENAGKTGMLREGMTAEVIDESAKFDGLADLKKATKDDIALLFGTEYLLGEISAVYKDLQSRMTAFYQNTLDKWAETWEQECGRKLLNRQRYLSGSLRVHLSPTAILRGTPNELAEYTGKLRTQGLISGNQGRQYHSLSPVPGLDDDYGNPNTSSGNQSQEPEPAEPEPDDDDNEEETTATASGQRAIERHFRNMIAHECRRVMQAAETDKGFIARVEEFYVGFERGLADLCDDLLIGSEVATNHCDSSKAQILELAGVVCGDQLHAP